MISLFLVPNQLQREQVAFLEPTERNTAKLGGALLLLLPSASVWINLNRAFVDGGRNNERWCCGGHTALAADADRKTLLLVH